jgi:hypothetical protein
LKPLTTYKNIVTEDRIVGHWNDSKKSVRIEKLANSRYKDVFKEARESNEPISSEDSIYLIKYYIISFEENGFAYNWIGTIAKIGDQQYVSLSPSECRSLDPKKKEFLEAGDTYSYAKLEWEKGNSLKLCFLNGDYIKEMILTGKARIKNEYDPLFGTFIITASAEELEQFLIKYGNDERLYRGGKTIRLSPKNQI